jgi:hypothetical protein
LDSIDEQEFQAQKNIHTCFISQAIKLFFFTHTPSSLEKYDQYFFEYIECNFFISYTISLG